MKHENISKEQLINELDDAHQQIAKLKKSLSVLMQDKEMLVQSDKSIRMHFTSSNDIILSFDNQFMIQNISPNVERIIGYRPEELVGKPFPSLNLLHPEDLEDGVDSALHVLSGGIVHSNILRFITKDGAEKYGEVSGVPITREGHVVAATSVIRDVTERIHNQEELQKYREHLEDMVKDRSAELIKVNKRLAHEIEKHKRTEKILRENEEQLKGMTNNLPGALYQFYARGNGEMGVSFVSGPTLELLGLESDRPQDFFSRFMECVVPEDRDAFLASIQDAVRTVSNWNHEVRFIKPTGEEIYIRGISRPRQIKNETVFYGVLLDITDQKNAEKLIQASENKFFTAFNLSPAPMMITELDDGRIIDLNKAWEIWSGYSRDEHLGHTTVEQGFYLSGQKDRERMLKTLMKKGTIEAFEAKLRIKGGQIRDVIYSLKPIEIDDKPHILSFIFDITEQRRLEKLLTESEERYRTLVDNANDIVFRTDNTGHFTFVNPAALRITGYGEEEIIGKHYRKLIRPDMQDEAIKIYVSQFENSVQNTYYEFPILTKQGHEIWIGQNTQLIVENGHVSGFQAVARDITERKRAEDALRESEAKYRFLTEKMNDIIWTMGLDFNFTYVSPSVERILGFTQEERMSQEASKRLTPESLARSYDHLHAGLKYMQKKGADPERKLKFELEYYHKNGSTVWMETVASFVHDDAGKVIGIHGVSRDITDRKRAEEALRQSEAKYRFLTEKMNDEVWTTDLNFKPTYISPSAQKIHGFTPDESIQRTLQEMITPESYAHAVDVFAEELKREQLGDADPERTATMELQHYHKNGSTIWIETVVSFIRDDAGKAIGIYGVSRDINDRKRAEHLSQIQQKKFVAAFHDSPAPMVITDAESGRFIDANQSFLDRSGYSLDDLVGHTVMELDPEGTRERDKLVREARDKGIVNSWELKYRTKAGDIREVLHSAKLIEIDDRLCLLSHLNDITDRKRAEEALRQSEAKYRFLTEKMNDIIWTMDLDFRITYGSPSFTKILGYTPEERMSMEPGERVTPESLARAQETLLEALKYVQEKGIDPERSITLELECYHKNGSIVWMESKVSPIIDETGKITGIHGVSRDITKRKQAEKELKKYREQLEDLVKERTAELTGAYEQLKQENEVRKTTELALRSRESELEKERKEVNEVNATLKVLLKHREEDKANMEMDIISNIKISVLPYVEKLETSRLEQSQKAALSQIKIHLNDIASPFVRKISSEYLGLTPSEIKVASLIKEGRSSKDIAEILNISLNTVITHRYSIRKKTGLKNKKMNLRSYLQVLE